MKITLKEERDQALDAGFRALQGRLPSGMDFESFKKALKDWEVKAFVDGDMPVGMLMVNGKELHVAVVPEVRGKWLSRRLIREVFSPLFKQYGEAVTKVMPDNKIGTEFVNRLGFSGDVLTLKAGFASGKFDPVSAMAVAGGSNVIGSIIGAKGAKDASRIQADATNRATELQNQQFLQTREDQQPWMQTGGYAIRTIGDLLRNGSLFPNFSGADLTNEPGYQFRLAEGNRAIDNAARARGMFMSPATVKELLRYNQDFASNEYTNAFNRDLTNKTTKFNMLSGAAGSGQTAANTLANAGANNASTIGNLITSGANARGAAGIAGANAIGGGISNIGNLYMQSQMMNRLFPTGGGNGYFGSGAYNPSAAIYNSGQYGV